MTRLVFVDTETTGLHPDRRIWEIGMIARETGRADREYHAFIAASELDLGNADRYALSVGKFHQRHPDLQRPDDRSAGRVLLEYDAMSWVEQVTRGAVLVGKNINFDAEVLAARMRWNGLCPAWDYHLVDVGPLGVGWLVGQGRSVPPPPWGGKVVDELLGLPPTPGLHTAMGDARRVAEVFDIVAGLPGGEPDDQPDPTNVMTAAELRAPGPRCSECTIALDGDRVRSHYLTHHPVAWVLAHPEDAKAAAEMLKDCEVCGDAVLAAQIHQHYQQKHGDLYAPHVPPMTG